MEGFQAIAKRFINTTKGHLFLTGKAGTGKTTFLKSLSTITHKNFIVIAPTGIAALNAGGVTIHSQFLLPFGMFVPDRFATDLSSVSFPFYNQNVLAQKHPLNSSRKQVLRSIDLLVIDEVSMLRADLVDAIDYRMRAARGNFQESFGGVQVLFIGDLFQLPPVVKRDEEALLSKYYKSPWFYEARALQQDPIVFIEFDKIFRQHDQQFIDLLNNLRNNILKAEDIELLNKYFKPAEEIEELKEVVTLTTHNNKADELNSKALKALETPSKFFAAEVEGEFPENMYPVLQKIELKVGAQIMFVRNDPEGAYFNGKLATVKDINGSDVWVELSGSHVRYKLKKEAWKNKKYALTEADHELDEEVIGTFEQFPVKLAWAITVHKSQGLTFEKAIIDVAEAFADGQVYVALSRLRSLDGLILRTKIRREAVTTDKNIAAFVDHHYQHGNLNEQIKKRQLIFLNRVLDKTFDFSGLIKDLQYIVKQNEGTSFRKFTRDILIPISDVFQKEKGNTEKFRSQLNKLLESDRDMLLDRLAKGSAYYRNLLNDNLKVLLNHLQEMRQQKKVKTYVNQLTELDVIISSKIADVDKSLLLIPSILNGEENIDLTERVKQRTAERQAMLEEIRSRLPELPVKKKKKKKRAVEDGVDADNRSTYDITLSMFKDGLSVDQICEKRSLVRSTIEGHLAKAVEAGMLEVSAFVSEADVEEVTTAMKQLPEENPLAALYGHFKGRFSYGTLRAIVAHLKITS